MQSIIKYIKLSKKHKDALAPGDAVVRQRGVWAMQYEQTDYRVWKYVKDSEGIDWAEANRQMELGWLESEQEVEGDDLDIMGDPENFLEDGSIDDFEEGFIRGYAEAV